MCVFCGCTFVCMYVSVWVLPGDAMEVKSSTLHNRNMGHGHAYIHLGTFNMQHTQVHATQRSLTTDLFLSVLQMSPIEMYVM